MSAKDKNKAFGEWAARAVGRKAQVDGFSAGWDANEQRHAALVEAARRLTAAAFGNGDFDGPIALDKFLVALRAALEGR